MGSLPRTFCFLQTLKISRLYLKYFLRHNNWTNVTIQQSENLRKLHLKLFKSSCGTPKTSCQSIIDWPIAVIHPCLITHPFSKASDPCTVLIGCHQIHMTASVRRGSITIDLRCFCTRAHTNRAGITQIGCAPWSKHAPCDFQYYLVIHAVFIV